ncbi:hypothetical protein CFN78_20460 [Amycolatopsis antarctica]|uniref:DUF2993 domain-containing protein n=1 Tax=Amycolatopsis antarctica TaxID=1854586 RepID=A0A263CZB4_9PSEU|nr:DUF2993 domain-containing protein [Amycolatopsis antarctica]OZM71514.1 hypothetical protein CFN78_20460 [Amycolatopsis antarctica]
MVSSPGAQYAQTAPRPRGRRTRKIFIVLAVLLVLLIGADFGAAAFAEHTVSQKAREQFQLTDDPSVTIHGFPFATQAISGDYGHLSVRAGGVPVKDTLRDVELSAELREVRAPLSDLTGGNTDNIRIGRLEGQVKIKDSDIARVEPLTKIADLKIEPSSEEYVRDGEAAESDTDGAGSGGEAGETTGQVADEDSSAGIRMSGRLQVAGENLEIFAFAMIELDGNTVRITPERLQFGNDRQTTVVPPEVQQALLPNFEAKIDTGNLPFKVTPTAVLVEKNAIIIKGEAKDVTFAGVAGG